MSRRVDMTTKLSENDIEYLHARDRHLDLAYLAANTGTTLPEHVLDAMQEKGIEVPRAQKVAAGSNAGGEAQTAENGSETPSEPVKYTDAWFESATVGMLKAELLGRDLPVTGKRDELADRLYADLIDKEELPDDDESSDNG
jgi:hypothetical protein